jgi:ApaG protein
MYCEVTQNIRIEAEPSYIPEQSKPEENYYFFSYRIKIVNQGAIITQLVSRHWIITDGNGTVHEVKGPGVVGQQPSLKPGESFEYSSFCPLPTPTGNMRGTFQMIDSDQKEFEARIPLFFLRDLRNFH